MPAKIIEILSSEEMRRTLTRLASQVAERSRDLSQLVILGIYTICNCLRVLNCTLFNTVRL